jgi:hypothetical protein
MLSYILTVSVHKFYFKIPLSRTVFMITDIDVHLTSRISSRLHNLHDKLEAFQKFLF